MTDAKTKREPTLTLKVPLRTSRIGHAWSASTGAYSASGSDKPAAVSALRERVEAALRTMTRDKIDRVAVVDRDVYLLANWNDAAWSIVHADLYDGEASLYYIQPTDLAWKDRDEATSSFSELLICKRDAHRRQKAQRGTRTLTDAEASLHHVARAMDVDADGLDHAALGQRLGLKVAEWRRVVDAVAQTPTPSDDGVGVEGKALARLLGLRGSFHATDRVDSTELRREAEAIVRSADGREHLASVADMRGPGQSVLDAVHEAATCNLAIDEAGFDDVEDVDAHIVECVDNARPGVIEECAIEWRKYVEKIKDAVSKLEGADAWADLPEADVLALGKALDADEPDIED